MSQQGLIFLILYEFNSRRNYELAVETYRHVERMLESEASQLSIEFQKELEIDFQVSHQQLYHQFREQAQSWEKYSRQIEEESSIMRESSAFLNSLEPVLKSGFERKSREKWNYKQNLRQGPSQNPKHSKGNFRVRALKQSGK